MSAPDSKKKFGLILASARRAQEAHAVGVRRLNPLQDSDDELERDEEEEESAMDWVQAALKKSGGGNSAQLAQQQRLMREALEQDSSVFQYDELYDDLQATRDTKRQEKEGQDKKPKYIHNILKFAERRKLEKERRTERKVQKEREAEKGLFKDKESFVTPAYLNKLEEMKKAEEQDRIDAIIEEKNDVAKHKNMGIFFNHLFRQRMGEGEPSIKKEPGSNTENNDAATAPADLNIRKREGKSRGNQYRSQRAIDDSPTRSSEDPSQRRSSGRQDSSDSDDDSSTEERRRDRSKSRSASPRRGSRSRSPLRKKSRSQTPTKNKTKSKCKSDDVRVKSEPLSSDENERKDEKSKSKKVGKHDNDVCEKKVESKESREERIIKLFTKRTVGDKFIEAQQRYFQRKAESTNNVAKGL